MTKKPQTLRNVPLETLRRLKDETSPLVYAAQIKETIKGREMTNLRARFLGERVADHSKEREHQEELLEYLLQDIDDAGKKVQEKVSDVNAKRAIAEEAYQAYLKAKTAWEKADQALATAIAAEGSALKDQSSIEHSYDVSDRRLSDINTIVLVHRSANVGQIMDHHLGKIIVTEADSNYLGNLIKPDTVFDSSLSDGTFGDLPYEFKELPQDEKRSIVQFVEMALYYYLMQEHPVVLLYASEGLDTILKKEGM